MKKIINGIMCIAITAMLLVLTACGNDVYSSRNSAVENELKVNPEKARVETETEVAERAKRQAEIAKAKAEVQKQNPDSELVMSENTGEVMVASSTRMGVSIPTFFFFPKDYDPEKTYPLIIMFAGFSADHDNGTRFDHIREAFNEEGMMVVQYDNPGYGKSEESNLAYTLTNVKNDALDVLKYAKDNFNIDKVGAFGYDVGGRAVMEIQVDKQYDFDHIELVGPFCKTEEFVKAMFGQKKWNELKAKALDDNRVEFGKQEYSLQWFLDWERKEDTLTDDFCKAYKNRRVMLVFSTKDDCIETYTMDSFYKKIGAAAIVITDAGHDLGVRGYSTPKETERVIREESVAFMNDLMD